MTVSPIKYEPNQTRDPSLPSVIEALQNVMADVRKVSKDQTMSAGAGGTFKFRGIDAILYVVGPMLRKHRVLFIPHHVSSSYATVQVGKEARPTREVTLEVTYRIYGPGGDYIETVVPAESLDGGDKGTAKAMSVAFRTVLIQVLAIPTGEKDPDESVYERTSERAPRGPGGSIQEDPVDAGNVLQQVLTNAEKLRDMRGQTQEQKIEGLKTYLTDTKFLGLKGVWDENSKTINWDKVSPGNLTLLLNDQRQVIAKTIAETSPA